MADVVPIVRDNIARESVLMTDESSLYTTVGRAFQDHEFVNNGAGEYVRDEVHTNTVEGYLSIFKGRFKGVYQHCGEQHLHRYLAEYDVRYNARTRLGYTNADRAAKALRGADGKRLTYQSATKQRGAEIRA